MTINFARNYSPRNSDRFMNDMWIHVNRLLFGDDWKETGTGLDCIGVAEPNRIPASKEGSDHHHLLVSKAGNEPGYDNSDSAT